RLERRQSNYKAVFDALVAIAEQQPEREAVEDLLKGPDPDPMDFAALDAAWEEEEVNFGPAAQSQSSCGRDGLQSRLRHASRAVKSPAA
ncbi:MAG: nitrate reductase molybdenum cofactor assembly chaperone, partial [Afipia sp.]|nr:nitrate reductase molybdenum cofactor assembly chaperone [Afipia sp.]